MTIKIIGPRGAGKSVLVAAIAYGLKTSGNSPINWIKAIDDKEGSLARIVEDFLKQQVELASTEYEKNLNEIPEYGAEIQIKSESMDKKSKSLKTELETIKVSCQEYSGELIQELLGEAVTDRNLDVYLDDCASASKLLFLIDGTALEDEKYAKAFKIFKNKLGDRISTENTSNHRIAIVFSKCEQSEVWIYRHKIEKFARLKFYETQEVFAEWKRQWGCEINYYFCSAFGFRGGYIPNIKLQRKGAEGTFAVIEKPENWKPIGLLAPLYWLETGKNNEQLKAF